MSAAEVIEQIKCLPPDEKRAVKDFVQEMDTAEECGPKYVADKDLDETVEQVFRDYEDLFRKLAQ
jgi:hypothetical protein